jgi:23S rRNA (pseudouridine1915-N3)-methyltransferase
MLLKIISPGKTKKKYLAEGIADFQHRLKVFADCQLIYTKDSKGGSNKPDRLVMEEEGQSLLVKIERPALVIALDPKGEEVSSEKMAGLLSRWEQEGRRTVIFLIGGHLGLSDSILEQADMLLSLSQMTFTHEMARLLLLEQLYRAFTIRQGSGYHK